METWLLLGIFAYIFFAVSTSIDKYLMNRKYDAVSTGTYKMFYDFIFLLAVMLLFFSIDFSAALILYGAVLGLIYALSTILYFSSLRIKDAETVVPYMQSGQLLLVFAGSLLLFSEQVSTLNIAGVVLILAGVYMVLSQKHRRPAIDKGFWLMSGVVVLTAAYLLLAKMFLFDIQPIALAMMMYLSTTILLIAYSAFSKRCSSASLVKFAKDKYIVTAGFLGAAGTLLLYTAVSTGSASRVYPLAGIQTIGVFIIASLFLKERFTWLRLAGSVVVVAGVFLVAA